MSTRSSRARWGDAYSPDAQSLEPEGAPDHPATTRMTPFRFGVNVGPSRSRVEWMEKARKIEGLGYDALTVPDHLADFLAPMPALVSAAEATTTLRVGTNVLNNDFRHPVLVAREAATVDLLTRGRLMLGFGCRAHASRISTSGAGL